MPLNLLVHQFPKPNLYLAGLLVLVWLAVSLWPATDDQAPVVDNPVSLAVTPGGATEYISSLPPPTNDAAERELAIKIRPGDSLSSIFNAAGLPASSLHSIMSLGPEVEMLRKIVPGNLLSMSISQEGELISLKYHRGPLERVLVNRQQNNYEIRHQHLQPDVLQAFRAGNITDKMPSLFESGKAAGLSDTLVMELSNVFQWDISFALDLRNGDSFALLYEENYLEGQKVKDGNILGAEFNNLGKSYAAILYESLSGSKGYYSPDGKSMRKAFMRDPVHFSRVSSRFNLRRLHPIHKRVMPHRGIDYSARTGTPVVASGDGKVSIARQNSASGKYIVLQHGDEFTTKYLHLSKFAKGIRVGRRVQQGEVIGYVGATGWATAPHLHYEFLVNGVHRNPQTVNLPQASPIPASERERFLSQATAYLERIEKLKRPDQLAALSN